MINNKQEETINNRIRLVVTEFLCNENITIKELSAKLKIPNSTIQRDLNNIEKIVLLFKNDSERILNIIKNRLIESKSIGNRKGGLNYKENNIAIKNELGRFNGSNKRCK